MLAKYDVFNSVSSNWSNQNSPNRIEKYDLCNMLNSHHSCTIQEKLSEDISGVA